MIRKRAETDTANPPGSFRPPKYLRDIIARIEDEEGKPVATFNVSEAPTPLPSAEKRLEALKQALLRVCDTADGNPLYNGGHGISSALIRKLVAESS